MENNRKELYQWVSEQARTNRKCFRSRNLGLGMELVRERYGLRIFLLDTEAGEGCEIVDRRGLLAIATVDDIDIESIHDKKLAEEVLCLYCPYPEIGSFANGVAEFVWVIQEDGRYYADEDGFGMESGNEVSLRGFINREGRILAPLCVI